MEDVTDYADADLRAVHLALLRRCATRGERARVLGVPMHYRETETPRTLPPSGGARPNDETRARSYGALFHPWAIVRETTDDADTLAWPVAPESICGRIALRTIDYGAWYSVANQVLQGVVSLSHGSTMGTVALLDARANPWRAAAARFRGARVSDADRQRLLVELHVRRLLIMLRRLALREGQALVFQTNDAALRRLAERQFNAMLTACT
jgi:phage tail sheath protein FI